MSGSLLRRVRVTEVEQVAKRIKRFRLVDIDNAPLSEFSGVIPAGGNPGLSQR